MHACRRVSTPDPTDVAKEFATSLAPKAQARMNEITNAVATIQIYSGGISESAMRAQQWLSGLQSHTVLSANIKLDRMMKSAKRVVLQNYNMQGTAFIV